MPDTLKDALQRIEELEKELADREEERNKLTNLESEVEELRRVLLEERDNSVLLQQTIVKMAAKFTGVI